MHLGAQQILDALPDLLLVVDTAGVFRQVHAARPDLVAAEPSALPGRRVADVLPAELAERCTAAVAEACGSQEVVGLEYAMDLPVGPRQFEARVVPVGADVALVVVRDVTAPVRQARPRLGLDRLAAVLGGGTLEVHHQPIVRLADGGIEGVEALARWRHPSLGLLPAHRFIGQAERLGVVIDLGREVLERACRDVARLDPDPCGLTLNVNVSARQLVEPGFAEVTADAVDAAGLAPTRLRLEVTESTLLEPAVEVDENLAAVRALGAQVVLDDFGTGYATLRYLKRFPLDGLKLDRSFVRGCAEDERDRAIVSAVAALAGRLGLDLVAEGVETEAQVDALLDLGIRRGQGWRFAPALPLEDLAARLAQRPTSTVAERRNRTSARRTSTTPEVVRTS